MAEQTTIARPAPYLEAAGERFVDLSAQLAAKPVSTAAFAPTIAGQNVLTQAAQQQAATQAGLGALQFDPTTGAVSGVGAGTGVAGYQPFLQQAAAYTGPSAYQQFMSPYQQDVISTSLSEFDRQRQIAQQQLAGTQIAQGAFGQGRGQVAQAEFAAQSLQDRALLEAQLRQQGFSQAQQQASQAFAQQQALAQEQARQAGQGFTQQQSLAQQQAQLGQQQLGFAQQQPTLAAQQISQLSGLGQSDLAYRQALIDAQAVAAKEAQYEPFTRLGLVGQQLAQIQPGAFPTQTVGYQQPQAPASPLQTVLGVGTGLAGLAGSMKGIFG